jgi:hypothetical protein
MKHMTTVLAFAFAACLTVLGDEVRTNAPTDHEVHASKGTRIWITSFAQSNSPITLSTEQREWPLADGIKCTPNIPLDICRGWRTNYAIFRQRLISAAERAQLDFASLAKVLPELDLRQSPMRVILPVEAHSAEVNGELSWIVTYRWENVGFGPEPDQMIHFMARAFSQRTLKEVWGMQCD